MKVNEYGMKYYIALRTQDGVQELGPLSSWDEILPEQERFLVWISLRDHDDMELVYIRVRGSYNKVQLQFISQHVVDFTYDCPAVFTITFAKQIIRDSIGSHFQTMQDYADRLQQFL